MRHAGVRMSDVLTISEVAERSGVATSALRFYEEQGLIHSERNGFRPSPLPARGDTAGRVHRLCAEGRAVARRDSRPSSRGCRDIVCPERSDWAKLSGEWKKRIRARIAGARAPGGGPQRVHRVRMPVARPLRAGQPRRSSGAPGCRSAILDRRNDQLDPNPQPEVRLILLGLRLRQASSREMQLFCSAR